MESNILKKGLQSIYGGLQMLSESKFESMSTLAEVSIILNNTDIRDRYQLDDSVNEFFSAIHFLLKDLSLESVKIITEHIKCIESESASDAINIDYKTKYEQTFDKLIDCQEKIDELQTKLLQQELA